jgi:hypothetical protein
VPISGRRSWADAYDFSGVVLQMKFQPGIAAALLLAAGSSHAESEIDKFLSTDVITASDAKTVDQRCNAVLKLAGRTKAAIEKRKGAASIKADFISCLMTISPIC